MPGNVRARHAAASLVAVALSAAAAGGDAPELEMTFQVGAGKPMEFTIPGSDGGNGMFNFAGTLTDPGGEWELDYNLTGKPDPTSGFFNGNLISGNVAILNSSDSATSFLLVVDLPVDAMPFGALIGGSVALALTNTGGDGTFRALRDDAIWTALMDEQHIVALFPWPFEVHTFGVILTIIPEASFGLPDPIAAPPLESSIGLRIRFGLTDGDIASITSVFAALPRSGDLDGSGAIDGPDLELLLSSWGPCPGGPETCPADFDADGAVDIDDLLILLANWG